MLVEPTLLVEVMSSTSEMAPRWRSNGVATVLAITSGLAPGRDADTKIAGTSMRGSGATGSNVNVAIPHSATPNVSSIVATGRAMKGAEMFTPDGPPDPAVATRLGHAAKRALREPVERKVDDRCREQRQHLAHQQATHDAYAERMAQLGTGTGAEHQRQRAEDGGDRRHENRPEAQQTGLVDGLARREPLHALRLDGEVDHQDRVLLHDTDEQDDADERDDGEVAAGQHQRQQRADARRRAASREW